MPTIEEPSVHEEDNFQFSYHWILDFLSQPGQEGYIFARADDQRFIPGINADLVKDLGEKGLKAATIFLRTDTDEPIMYQIEKAGEALQALIVANLHEIIKETEEGFSLLTQLNFGRERLWELHIPILFWADERGMYLIANEAPDLHSQRRLSTVHFTGKMDVTVADMLTDREGWDAFLSTKESAALETNISILKKRLDGARNGGYPPLRTLAEIVVPLARDYARLGLAAEAEALLSDYKPLIEQTENDRLLAEVSGVYEAMHYYGQAIDYAKRAAEAVEHSFGPVHPSVSLRLNNLAVLLRETGRYEDAEPLMRRGLIMAEQLYGAEHREVAIRLNNLSGLLQATGRLSDAEPLMKQALNIKEKIFGAEHPEVAIGLNNLAGLLKQSGRLSEAEPLIRRALAIDEQTYGHFHPKVAVRLNNLGALLLDARRFEEAGPILRRALSIHEQAFGPNNPHVARPLNNLAVLAYHTSHWEEAEKFSWRALLIYFREIGAEHPDTQTAAGVYAAILQATGKTAEEAAQIIQDLQSSATSQ